MKVILGSSSPRRQQIMGLIFPKFETVSPNINEISRKIEPAEDFACRMSREKMFAIYDKLPKQNKEPLLAVTADTVVILNGRAIGKPADYEDAKRILHALSGKTHRVATALTLLIRMPAAEDKRVTDFAVTSVAFKNLSDAQIEAYLSSIAYADKAGAYSVQESEGIVESISGSLSNVVGFPARLFLKMIAAAGAGDLLM